MATVSVRYIVDDVDAAIDFYCRHLGFQQVMHPAPTFAMLSRGDLRLVLSSPSGQGGGGQAMSDGTTPAPGGWNRFSLEVFDLAATVRALREAGVHLRNDIVTGVGGDQVLLDDPSGNPVELFEPKRAEAALSSALPGLHSVTPRMVVNDAAAVVEFLRSAFGATGEVNADRPTEVCIGDSVLMVTPVGERELFPAFLYVYVDDADRAYLRALAAGAASLEEPLDTPYGDRRAMVRDPFGNVFQIAHRGTDGS